MNKSELVAAMAEKASLSKKDAEAALKAFTDAVADVLKKCRYYFLLAPYNHLKTVIYNRKFDLLNIV